MAKDDPYTLHHGDPTIGHPCPVCDEPFAAGDEVIACPRCKQLHHAACWRERGACSRLGCPQLASVVPTDQPRLTDDDRAKEYIRPIPRWIPWTAGILLVVLMFGIPLLRTYVFNDKRPKITVLLPSVPEVELIDSVISGFAVRHPELQVELMTAPSGPMYQQKLVILIGARDAPDLFLLPWASFRAFAEHGMYADISEWVESHPEALAKLPAERLARGAVDGVWYGVPHPGRSAFFGVFVNSELIPESLELLEEIIAALPVDEGIDDVGRVDTSLPYVPTLGF